MISGLLPHTPEELEILFRDIRAMIGLMDGGTIVHPIGDDAAALYAKLGGTATEKYRVVRLLELWINYVETGVLNIADSAEFALITGNDDVQQAPHIRATKEEAPPGDEILAAPKPKFRIIK